MTSSPIQTLPGVGGNNTSTTSPMNSDSEKDCSVLSETNKAGQNVLFPQFQQSPSKENDQPLQGLQLTPAIQVHHDSDNNSEKGQDLTETNLTSAAEAILTNSQ